MFEVEKSLNGHHSGMELTGQRDSKLKGCCLVAKSCQTPLLLHGL